MMKILITGANGQLGKEFHQLLSNPSYELVSLGRDDLDVTNLAHVQQKINLEKPDVIIHCAAYTKVDLAETNQKQAYLINAIGARNISMAAEEVESKLVYVSTDYVFPGTKNKPIHEFEKTDPCNVYGMSKLAGEHFCKQFSSKYFIVRTSWLFGEFGNNFVKTMLTLGKNKSQLKVVHDQIGSPTYTYDLAKKIIEVVHTDKYGVYHIANKGSCSWYELAIEIFKQTNLDTKLVACTSEEFQAKAQRPAYSVFQQMALELNGFKAMRGWQEALQEFLSKKHSMI